MVDGAFYAHKCYAQKCYYWVRDQEKIKSNEFVVTVVIGVLGIYDTKMRKPRSSYATRSHCQPEPTVYCHGYRKHRLEKECLRCSRCTRHFSVTSLMNKFDYLEADFTYINLRTWVCPACLGLCNCRECATQLLTPPPPSQALLDQVAQHLADQTLLVRRDFELIEEDIHNRKIMAPRWKEDRFSVKQKNFRLKQELNETEIRISKLEAQLALEEEASGESSRCRREEEEEEEEEEKTH